MSPSFVPASVRITLRLTPEEKEYLQKQAQVNRLSLSDYLRQYINLPQKHHGKAATKAVP